MLKVKVSSIRPTKQVIRNRLLGLGKTITRRNLLSVSRLDVIYAIAHIILAVTAKLLKLRVEVKPKWFKLEQNLTSKATTFLRLLKSCFDLLPPHKTLRL